MARRPNSTSGPSAGFLCHDRTGDRDWRRTQFHLSRSDQGADLIWSAVINSVAAVPIMAMITLMASRLRHAKFCVAVFAGALQWQ